MGPQMATGGTSIGSPCECALPFKVPCCAVIQSPWVQSCRPNFQVLELGSFTPLQTDIWAKEKNCGTFPLTLASVELQLINASSSSSTSWTYGLSKQQRYIYGSNDLSGRRLTIIYIALWIKKRNSILDENMKFFVENLKLSLSF